MGITIFVGVIDTVCSFAITSLHKFIEMEELKLKVNTHMILKIIVFKAFLVKICS